MAKEIKPMSDKERQEHLKRIASIETEIRSAGTVIVAGNVLDRHFNLTNFQRTHIASEIRSGKSLRELIDYLD